MLVLGCELGSEFGSNEILGFEDGSDVGFSEGCLVSPSNVGARLGAELGVDVGVALGSKLGKVLILGFKLGW